MIISICIDDKMNVDDMKIMIDLIYEERNGGSHHS